MKNIKALPGINAFTGNDYTPAFFKKGKIRPIQLMQKNKKFVRVFTNPRDFTLNTDTFNVLEEFTCHLCCHVKQNDLHDIIKLHFDEKPIPNCIQRHLGKIKSVEPTTFPRCRSAWYIAKLYRSTCEAYLMN